MDGSQTPGINYNSIDGLTTVAANSISINGSTINIGDYVTYTNATGTVNLNAKTLTNIANASAITDAVNLQTMNAKTYIGNIASYRSVVPTSGAMENYFITKKDYQSGVLKEESSGVYKNWYGQYHIYYNTSGGLCGTILPIIAGSLTFSATNIVIAAALSLGGTNKIINVANGVNPQDVATISQIPSITGLVPYSLATSNVDLNVKQLKNIADGTSSNDAISLQQLTSYIPSSIVNGPVSILCGPANITNTTFFGTIDSILGNGGVFTNYDSGFYQSRTTSFPTSTRTFGINIASPNAIEFTHTATGGGVVGFFNFTRKVKVQPITNSTDVLTIANAAGTSIFSVDTLTSAISCNTVVNANSNKIINLATATNAADAVRFDQLSAAIPAGSVQGSYITYSGSAYINNATTTVNLGELSGNSASNATNIGGEAGKTSQSANAVAVGYQAGTTTQGNGAVAIGALAGASYQGNNAVAIGNKAGQTSQFAGSIVLNASGVDLSPSNAGCYINPIRNDTSITILPSELMYNTGTYEIIRYDKPYWSLFTTANSGNYYVFTYVTNLPNLGYLFDMSSAQYGSSVDTGYGTAVWEGTGNPLTRNIAITIPYTGIYQINGSFAPNGTTARIVVGLEKVGGKLTEICDFLPADGLTSVSFAGTYYYTANSVLKLKAISNLNVAVSFSGHLVRRLQN